MSVDPGARVAIEILWGAGLFLALIATLVVLKESLLVIGVLRDIHHLAGSIDQAAAAIARNVEPVSAMRAVSERVEPVAGALGRVSRPLAQWTALVEPELRR